MDSYKLLKGTKHENNCNGMEEHNFIATCLQNGFKLEDLYELEYVDIAKIMFCLVPSDKKYRKATAEDWNKLM